MNLPQGVTIQWAQNPLETKVVLDDRAKENFKLRHVISRLVMNAYSAYFHLNSADQYYDPERARAELHELIEDNVEKLFVKHYADEYLEELEGRHVGDCTCVACSCTKCHSEELLGIDTLKGLHKHEAYAIASAFRQDGVQTAAQALAYLRGRRIEATEAWMAPHLERWRAENERASAWLESYININLNLKGD